jgi:hypothetical protein
MNSPTAALFWRWLALVALLGNAAFNIFAARLDSTTSTIAEVSARYPALFTPAPYAFAIWGLIYLATIAYAVFALRPSQRTVPYHDQLAELLVAYSILGVVWAQVFRRDHTGMSVGIIIAMFVIGAWMFGIAKRAIWTGVSHRLAGLPFALTFGWLSVAMIANTAVWIVSRHAFQPPDSEVAWSIGFIAAATIMAGIVARWYHDSIYPAVISWALAAIWVAQRNGTTAVAYCAAIGAILAAVSAVGNLLWVRRHPLLPSTQIIEGLPPIYRAH